MRSRGWRRAGAFGLFDVPAAEAAQARSSLTFTEIAHALETGHRVASGYDVQVLLRWGDPVIRDAPSFDPTRLSAAAQMKQFGYDNDFLAFMPLPYGSRASDRGLLCANHERTAPGLMWPGLGDKPQETMTQAQAEVEMASHGHTVVEIRRRDGRWVVVADSPYNRRFTPFNAGMRIAGPAAGHARLKTKADQAGDWVVGTLNNCAGGKTPWGTVLSGEENIPQLFHRRPGAVARGKRLSSLRHQRPRPLRLGPLLRPLQHREGAERAQPLRLGRRDRPL